MMAKPVIHMRVRWAWWWRAYTYGVAIMANLMQREPDYEKVRYWAGRACKVKIVRVVLPDDGPS
jgi:hypothetical protein